LFLTDSIADISHQLRTPLTSMNLMLEALSAPDITFEKRLRTAYELKRLVSRIDRLIEALLKISKIDSGTARFEKKEVLLRDLINQATLPLSATLDIRAQQLKVNVADESVVCDPSWTAEALLNVIKNCIEHNPDGKSLYITVTRTAIFTQITVEDEGNGIDKQDLAHIFERFYKSKSQKSDGFGIGLHLARTIMTEQNGTIKAENRKEGGARFILRFY
ncbi:MAG: HAMP domain-containing histidine kinase, partial [Clostridia bacterium]|nr:HAMP domain-containing histidine kinase [Clostridia bacterium]